MRTLKVIETDNRNAAENSNEAKCFLKNNKIKAYLVKIILNNREDTIKISETCWESQSEGKAGTERTITEFYQQ